jgi:tRNA-guanine family transglycosylase
MPLHVFGISSSLMPILAYLGVDSFDSASFLYAALNGRYFLDDFRRIHIDNVDFKECNCAICKDERYIKKMKNAKIRVKDRVSPIAIHNLIKHHTELEKIRTLIREDISEVWTSILDRSKNNKRLNKAITKVL